MFKLRYKPENDEKNEISLSNFNLAVNGERFCQKEVQNSCSKNSILNVWGCCDVTVIPAEDYLISDYVTLFLSLNFPLICQKNDRINLIKKYNKFINSIHPVSTFYFCSDLLLIVTFFNNLYFWINCVRAHDDKFGFVSWHFRIRLKLWGIDS